MTVEIINDKLHLDESDIAKTKDFIWEHLNKNSKSMAAFYATTNILSETDRSIKELVIGFEYNFYM